ncbi:hypothetical protein [Clostridium taeniosporum]|uniref:hypothetical protein n=1 Tax=Clostridium taeniosporum TaxID=394958 RepID=UPI00084E155E
MGAVHALRIKSPYKLLHVEDIKVIYLPNEHGKLYLKCLLDDSINFKYSIEASTKDEITVYEEKEDENNNLEVDINNVDISKSVVVFNGLVENIKTTNKDGLYYIEIEGISRSSEIDIKEKSRSFQNVNMTYDELIGTILKDYSGFGFVQCIEKEQAIEKPIFQYKETDWDFLRRISSELKSEIYCDIIDLNNLLYFGINNGKNYELQDNISYKATKDLKTFYKSGGYDLGFHDTDYFYYEIKSRERYNIGDNIYFKQKDVYVSDYEAFKYQDEIIYKYKLRRKNGVWQTKIYNSLLCGSSLEGKVLDVQGEEVKLHLNIDKKQDKGEGSWFKYAPPTGNAMYSMPVVGTSAKLYFPDESGNEPLVSGCVRSNGSSQAKTSDTTKRYFGTEHGSEIEMTPSALNIKGGSASPISISIDDSVGIKITSPKKLTLSADSEIIMKTPKNVKINGASQINALKTNTQSGFSLETDLHFLSNNVIKNGSSSESYPDFEDEPQAGRMPEPPKEEKKGFNWGKLCKNVLAGLAVVAAVTVAATAIAVTAGLAGPVIGAIAVGAAVSGTAAVGSMAVSDIKRGKVSEMSDYMWAGGREAFVGALSGAVFGPFGVSETIGGKMALGGITNAFESVVRQKLNGEDINWGTVFFDGGIGALTAGFFHYGGKFMKGASNYVKKSFNKVLSKNESTLMKLAKNLDDMLAPVRIAETPEGIKIPIRGEGNTKIQDTVSKIVDDAKGVGTRGLVKLVRVEVVLYTKRE